MPAAGARMARRGFTLSWPKTAWRSAASGSHERHFPNEDPATTHARLSAAVVASHANACAAADAFLSGSVPPDLRQMPPELKLTRNEAGRVAVIDTGTPDEREFTSHEALRAYVRRCVVMSLTVRRDGWTLPDPEDARIEPDSARLLLRPGNPVVDIVARIGMDRSRDAAHLRYKDSRDQMQRFDHHVHQLEDHGVRYVASLFTI